MIARGGTLAFCPCRHMSSPSLVPLLRASIVRDVVVPQGAVLHSIGYGLNYFGGERELDTLTLRRVGLVSTLQLYAARITRPAQRAIDQHNTKSWATVAKDIDDCAHNPILRTLIRVPQHRVGPDK